MGQLRLLACFAHPDDEAFGVAGTLALSVARGVDVRLVCATYGEAGDIRSTGSASRTNLGQVRYQELRQSCRVLGVRDPVMLGYRDSGWADDPAQHHVRAFVKAPGEEVVQQLVAEIRRSRPHVVLTFEPGGLSGHKDHIAISQHTTQAYQVAGDVNAFPEQLRHGLAPYDVPRLFYVARPRGYRLERALKLRRAGVEVPLPAPELRDQGVPPEHIHLTLDVSAHLDTKLDSMRCHRTQVPPDWPYLRVPRQVLTDMMGTEHFMQAYPPVTEEANLLSDLFAGLAATP